MQNKTEKKKQDLEYFPSHDSGRAWLLRGALLRQTQAAWDVLRLPIHAAQPASGDVT